MNGTVPISPRVGDEPSVTDLLGLFWRVKIPAVLGMAFGIVIAAIYIAAVPRIYEAEVVIVPASQSDIGGSLAGLSGQLGGLGTMLGISIPANGSAQEHLAILRARSFSESFIKDENLLSVLYPRGKEPALSDAVDHFDTAVRFIEEDRRTGLVTVRLQLADRERVAPLANKFVARGNETIRQRTMNDTELALKYLRQQAKDSPEVGVQEVIYRVMEDQMRMAALARTRVDFAFRVVDPAAEPSPKRFVSPQIGKAISLGGGAGLAGGLLIGLSLLARGRRSRVS